MTWWVGAANLVLAVGVRGVSRGGGGGRRRESGVGREGGRGLARKFAFSRLLDGMLDLPAIVLELCGHATCGAGITLSHRRSLPPVQEARQGRRRQRALGAVDV